MCRSSAIPFILKVNQPLYQIQNQLIIINPQPLIILTSVVPIIQSDHDNYMPEVMRMSEVVHFAVEESLGDAGDVEKERQTDKEIHANDTRHKYLRKKEGSQFNSLIILNIIRLNKY